LLYSKAGFVRWFSAKSETLWYLQMV